MRKLFITILFFTSALICQDIRPIRDNVGFCWDATEMDQFVSYLSKLDDASANIATTNLIGGISVHDDYLYAGRVYYPLYNAIRTKEVVIFGVTHGTVRKEMGNLNNVIILDEFSRWQGPYGPVAISPLRDIIKSKLPANDYLVSNKAQAIEHSIEALVPFLQHFNRDIKITPIMVTQMPFERMESITKRISGIITEYIKENHLTPGKDIFFLISNDANHYGEDFNNSPYGMDREAHEKATKNDQAIIANDLCIRMDKEDLRKFTVDVWPDSLNPSPKPLWCGRYPIVFGLLTISKVMEAVEGTGIRGKLCRYSDTYTEKMLPVKFTSMGTTAVCSYRHWCGFFTLGIYKDK